MKTKKILKSFIYTWKRILGVPRIGVDLGTATVLVYIEGKGIVIREPSVVALDKTTKKLLAIGEQAREMLGRTPSNIIAVRPLKDGVIADYDATEQMLKHFISQVCGKFSLRKPVVVISVPAEITSVEERAVIEAALSAGAKRAVLIEEPKAAAIGAGLPIDEASGNMVVDIGGGTTDIAVISLGGMVVSESLRIGGNKMDEAIVRYIRRNYNLMIGERTAEEIKIKIGSVIPPKEPLTMTIKGRDLIDGLPKVVTINDAEIREPLAEPVMNIIEGIKRVLEKTPPELISDIIDKGIVLTGGGSLLRGLDELLKEVIGLKTVIADDPLCCVAIGAGKASLG